MRNLIVFNNVTLDGRFASATGDMSWAHAQANDAEWSAFVSENAQGNGMLLFGRVTYEMMASFWPTPEARQMMPAVADGMNGMPKVVFSRTLHDVAWQNTTLVRDDLAATVTRLKADPGPDMVILGSGSIVAQLTQAGLIDEYQLVVNPIALGAGRTMFDGIAVPRPLRHTKTRTFRNGNVLLCYEPTA